jgi:hypothetical protein
MVDNVRMVQGPSSAGGTATAAGTLAFGVRSESVGVAPARLTRDEVLHVAASDKPWAFIPLGLRVLSVEPGDTQVRLLVAANLARLGLRTVGLEVLGAFDGPSTLDPTFEAIRRVLAALPPDAIPAATRIATARANLDAWLGRAGGDAQAIEPELRTDDSVWRAELERRFDAWAACADEQEWFRAADGNTVRRRRADGQWLRFNDDAGDAAGLTLGAPGASIAPDARHAGTPSQPLYLEGIDPVQTLRRLWSATPTRKDGARTRIVIVLSDPEEAFDALSAADVREIMGDDRVEVLLGPDAGQRLAHLLARRFDTALSGRVVVSARRRATATIPRAAAPGALAELVGIEAIIRAALDAQRGELLALGAAANACYDTRDRAWWAKRFATESLAREPLRVLIPTCRYSTFIQHSSADIAEALRAAGCEVRTIIEPDDRSTLSALAYVRPQAEWQPDLVLFINYPRSALGATVHRNIPFACWVQDAMPHLFDRGVGASQGALDFLVGLLRVEFFTRFAWPRERALASPVLASAAKFHEGEVPREMRARLGCEVACVTNHSQTPESLLTELRQQIGPDGAAMIDELYPELRRFVLAPAGESYEFPPDQVLRAVMHRRGMSDDHPTFMPLYNNVVLPLADRLLRHQMLEWASSICTQRGWRLHIYGRGWEQHPTLAHHARGTLAHGDELRAAYRLARANLHAVAAGSLHQRLSECALSGGFSLIRVKRSDLELIHAIAGSALAERAEPVETNIQHWGRDCARYGVADAPEGLAYMRQRQALGMGGEATVLMSAEQRANRWDYWGGRQPPRDLVWAWGDLSEIGFDTRQTLEAKLDDVVNRERESWREHVRTGIQRRVREHLTYEGFVGSMIEMIRSDLARV